MAMSFDGILYHPHHKRDHEAEDIRLPSLLAISGGLSINATRVSALASSDGLDVSVSNESELTDVFEQLHESPTSLTVPHGTARFLLYGMGHVDYGRPREGNPLCRQNASESAYSPKVSSRFGYLGQGRTRKALRMGESPSVRGN